MSKGTNVKQTNQQTEMDLIKLSFLADDLAKDFSFADLCVESNGICELNVEQYEQLKEKFYSMKTIIDRQAKDIEQTYFPRRECND